jgi:hypothetical protein
VVEQPPRKRQAKGSNPFVGSDLVLGDGSRASGRVTLLAGRMRLEGYRLWPGVEHRPGGISLVRVVRRMREPVGNEDIVLDASATSPPSSQRMMASWSTAGSAAAWSYE